MSIGNHTFWIIVDLDTLAALTPESDRRRAMRFESFEAAEKYRQRYQGNFVTIRVPA